MFTPKWKKEAQNFYKAGKKFLNFKRDLLKDDRIKEIESRLRDLKLAMKGRGQAASEKTKEAVRQLDNTCEQSLPRHHRSNPVSENIESFFVTLVIVIGFRSYIAQPFIIPTGSMQPTLNGVICQSVDKDEWSNPIVRIGEKVLRGRAHVHKVAPVDLVVPRNLDSREFLVQNPGSFKLVQAFHRVTKINFENKTISAHNLPSSALWQGGEFSLLDVLKNHGVRQPNGTLIIPKGTVLYSGYADSGDVVIADKISYHFRKPRRGESFIFDTRDLNTTGEARSRLVSQQNAQHYIKRCVGIPGDTLQINRPNMLVNGEIAEEPYMRRVMERKGPYAEAPGYITASAIGFPNAALGSESDELVLKDSTKKPWKAEYAAMGDNTQNSLDSRYWGSVKEYNIVAPAFFTLWPITTGHWGFVK